MDLQGISAIEIGALTRFYTWSHFLGGSMEVRLDAPAVGADLEPPTRIPLAPTSGVHDVYIVFHNPVAQRSDALMLLRSIEFLRPEEAAQ